MIRPENAIIPLKRCFFSQCFQQFIKSTHNISKNVYFRLCLRWYKQRSYEVILATGIFRPEHFNIWNSFWHLLCVQRINLREDISQEMLVCSLRCSSKIYLLVYSPCQSSRGALKDWSTFFNRVQRHQVDLFLFFCSLWFLIRLFCFHLICKVM